MHRPPCTCWLPIGLVLLTSGLASAANAAVGKDSPEIATGEEIRIAQIAPDATLGAEPQW